MSRRHVDRDQSEDGHTDPPPSSSPELTSQRDFVWKVEPIQVALHEAQARRERRPEPESFEACTEVGRRMLLAQFTFSSWVLRRVEKVQFVSDRRIMRSSTIEFMVPPDAPVIHAADGEPRWLIPLSVMRRRTLVNLDLRKENAEGIGLLGLRFTQKLDESMLRAASRLACPEREDCTEIDGFIREVISGPWSVVQARRNDYERWRKIRGTPEAAGHPLDPYFRDATFRATLERLWHNFTLYVTVPVNEGRHRILRLAFEERVKWEYQLPSLERESVSEKGREIWTYQPLARKFGTDKELGHFIGWRPTRIRLLVPSAENCASYHFEFTAPTGLWITKAAFVGGRPNLGDIPHVTPWDAIETPEHAVGLHAVEVPNGSLCRAQVHLRVPTRGWLSTLMVSCWAAVLALAVVAYHARLYGHAAQWNTDQVTNMVLLLVTVTAGAATYVAQHPAGAVAARMVTGLRVCGVAALTLPAVAAVFLITLKEQPTNLDVDAAARTRHLLVTGLGLMMALAVTCAVVVTVAWVASWRDERRLGAASPWDMTTVAPTRPEADRKGGDGFLPPMKGDALSFDELCAELEFKQPAVGVYSAEGWHERYGWDDDAQKESVTLLRGATNGSVNPTGCDCTSVSAPHPRVPRAAPPGRPTVDT